MRHYRRWSPRNCHALPSPDRKQVLAGGDEFAADIEQATGIDTNTLAGGVAAAEVRAIATDIERATADDAPAGPLQVGGL